MTCCLPNAAPIAAPRHRWRDLRADSVNSIWARSREPRDREGTSVELPHDACVDATGLLRLPLEPHLVATVDQRRSDFMDHLSRRQEGPRSAEFLRMAAAAD